MSCHFKRLKGMFVFSYCYWAGGKGNLPERSSLELNSKFYQFIDPFCCNLGTILKFSLYIPACVCVKQFTCTKSCAWVNHHILFPMIRSTQMHKTNLNKKYEHYKSKYMRIQIQFSNWINA